jgi:hypothetical protein
VTWDVEFTDEFESWWNDLDASEQENIDAVVGLLETEGPSLPYPYSSRIVTARKYDLRELRIQHEGRPYRVLYAFHPRRSALLILGGDKTGDDRWYQIHVPRAEKIYGEHLAYLKEKGGLQ